MKQRERYFPTQTTPNFSLRVSASNQHLNLFLQKYVDCDFLYRMTTTQESKQTNKQPLQITLIKHAFVNRNQFQTLPKPSLSINTTLLKRTNNKSLFDTFNYTDFSQNNEDEQYSNYLKQYETLKKDSRKIERQSPQLQKKEMNLLINQFLSDISNPTTSTPNDQKSIQNPISNKQTKVEKIQIDLNAFQINKPNKNSPTKSNKDKSIDKRQKQTTPRFIKINDINVKARKKQQQSPRVQKSSEKKQIEVIKVTNLGTKPNTNKFQRHIEKVTIAKNIQRPSQAPQQKQVRVEKKQQLNSSNNSHSYSKNRQLRARASSTKVEKIQKKQEESQTIKKPIKIQIEIPLQELKPQEQAKPVAKEEHIQQLDYQSQQIIKDISHKVYTLLQKSKDIAKQHK